MKVIYRTPQNDVAAVFIATDGSTGRSIEFVESTPTGNIREKWVLILSSLYGCPVRCAFCDAGGGYSGPVPYEELLFQVRTLIGARFPGSKVDCGKFKVQFARIGEPSFNDDILKAIADIPRIFELKSYIPSLSTVAPAGREHFFEQLLELIFKEGLKDFQLQFSIHSTDAEYRDRIIPFKKWGYREIAEYSQRFFKAIAPKKVTLNFALTEEAPFSIPALMQYFSPEIFVLKFTPVNPTLKARENGIGSFLGQEGFHELMGDLQKAGYDTIVSIGDLEENKIGSNCGQYIRSIEKKQTGGSAYTYPLIECGD